MNIAPVSPKLPAVNAGLDRMENLLNKDAGILSKGESLLSFKKPEEQQQKGFLA